jgi:hypothetical protein
MSNSTKRSRIGSEASLRRVISMESRSVDGALATSWVRRGVIVSTEGEFLAIAISPVWAEAQALGRQVMRISC